MHLIRATGATALVAASLALAVPAASARVPAAQATPAPQTFVVLYAAAASGAHARAAIAAAGGQVRAENTAIRSASVSTTNPGFRAAANRQRALAGVAADQSIGALPRASVQPVREAGPATAKPSRALPQAVPARTGGAAEPLAAKQWNLRLIRAFQAQAKQAGDRRVKVGVIDTGIDGKHPDLAANFDRATSRNFVTDLPLDPSGQTLDGPCEVPSCIDPVDVDDNGHGTHVASTIASPINKLGIAGVAPNVTVVNLRAGQDSGLFFLRPTLEALTYAGRSGIDVVNLSFYLDPWLFNCDAHPADTAAQQQDQRVTKAALQRAINFAYSRGVTVIAAAGNESTDLGRPGSDATSPDYPLPTATRAYAYPRKLDNASCQSMPAEAEHVITVTSVGPSRRLSAFSNYGLEQATVAAPGGDSQDRANSLADPANRILAAYPRGALVAEGLVRADGQLNPTSRLANQVIRSCPAGRCAYWRYLQGTSMAAPHAAGVAALIVSAYGVTDPHDRSGLTLSPARTEQILTSRAAPRSCPQPRTVTYTGSVDGRATCAGSTAFNGFYGLGIVDALAAVRP